VEEALERAAEAISVHIAGLESDGETVPEEREHPRIASVTVAA
jgi:predicted RNase H-like HicB family nuclease